MSTVRLIENVSVDNYKLMAFDKILRLVRSTGDIAIWSVGREKDAQKVLAYIEGIIDAVEPPVKRADIETPCLEPFAESEEDEL